MKGCLAIVVVLCLFLVLRGCGHHTAPAKAPSTPPKPVAVAPARPDAPNDDLRSDWPPGLATCVQAVTSQSDPTKLATLGTRGANPRLKRIMYYLASARDLGTDAGQVIDQAQKTSGSAGTPRASLVKASLLRNLKICDGLGLLTPENRQRLRRGYAPIVTRGPYAWQTAEVDHIVPRKWCPETDNELANLEMLPESLNRAKGAKVGDRQLDVAKRFRAAGLISEATMANVQAVYRPAGTNKYELQEP